MPLHPAQLNDDNLIARIVLPDAGKMREFGRRFAAALNPEEKTSIGFIAAPSTGKTTLASGIYEGLGATHGNFHDMMVGINGYCDTRLDNNSLLRHFDLAVQPEGEENIPHHWNVFDAGLQEAGVELVEHAMRCRDERYSYIFNLEVDHETKARIVNVHAAPELATDTALFEPAVIEAA